MASWHRALLTALNELNVSRLKHIIHTYTKILYTVLLSVTKSSLTYLNQTFMTIFKVY